MSSRNVLWTGGFDSTFRVLCLLLIEKVPVQPLYVIDRRRASWPIELETMERVRSLLATRFPAAVPLLQPLRRFEKADIADDAVITGAYEQVRARTFLGNQYDWLPRLCRHGALEDVELSIHADDKAHHALAGMVVAVEQPGGKGETYALAPGLEEKPEYQLFRDFTMPIFHWTKIQMEDYAREHGFHDLLDLGWFCFTPLAGQPCGMCNPCVYTIQEGMGHRLPFVARYIRYPQRHLRRRISRLKASLKSRFR